MNRPACPRYGPLFPESIAGWWSARWRLPAVNRLGRVQATTPEPIHGPDHPQQREDTHGQGHRCQEVRCQEVHQARRQEGRRHQDRPEGRQAGREEDHPEGAGQVGRGPEARQARTGAIDGVRLIDLRDQNGLVAIDDQFGQYMDDVQTDDLIRLNAGEMLGVDFL